MYNNIGKIYKESPDGQIYHLSEENLNGKVLNPSVPDNFMTEKGYEDDKTPRVSFAESIDGALIGISSNLTGKEFFVHVPARNDYKYLCNKKVQDKVPDAHISQEVWILEDVEVKCVGKIKVTGSTSEAIPYKYGDMWADTYEWDWEYIGNTGGDVIKK